jgi:hypothetical protein
MTNKVLIHIFFSIVLILTFSQAAAADFFVNNAITDGQRPYQLSLNVSNSTGTNNATHIFCNGNCNTNFTDIRFMLNNTIALPYWIENTTTGKVWVNVTANGSVKMYYGNASSSSLSNGTNTFIKYHGATSSEFIDSVQSQITNIAYEAIVRVANVNSNVWWGVSSVLADAPGDALTMKQYSTNAYINAFNNSVQTSQNQAGFLITGQYYRFSIRRFANQADYYINGTKFGTSITTNLPDANLGLGMNFEDANGADQLFSFIRYYTNVSEPQWVTWGAEQDATVLPILASDTVRYSNDSIIQFLPTGSLHEVKKITILENYNGSWKINFTLISDGFFIIDGQIYKNGVPYGTYQTTSSTSQTFSQTFSNISILIGDNISIYAGTTYAGYLKDFRIEFDYDYANITPTLTYPTNGSTISFAFPPQFADINFTWTNIGESGYQIQIAKDAAFNLIAWDVTSTTNSKSLPLEADVWYWRVRTYNDGGSTLGEWSDTFTFTFSETAASVAGTAINGVVFEYIGGVATPISGASVYLTNSTYTTFAATGSNGYFLFDGLDNTTAYSLYAIKQGYDNSQVFAVLPIFNATTTVNLPMRIYISPYVPNFVFEKFIVRTLFDDPYQGVTVNIFVGSGLSPAFTGTTDSMGQAVFQLVKDTYYRIELTGGGLPSTITEYFYAKEEAYYITIAGGFPDGGDKFEDINATLFVTEINATHANLSLYYSDNSSTTSIIYFYARYYINGTNACANQSSATYPVTLNCTVLMSNNTYLFGWNSTSSQYGVSQGVDVVDFKANNVNAQVPGLQEKMGADMLNWLSIIGLIFIAGIFSAKSVKFAAVVVPFAATIMYWIGTLQVSALLVHSALILGILVYIRMNEQKVTT